MRQGNAGTLTRRERDVLALVAKGHPTGEVAARLGIAAGTVESHVRAARAKLGTATRRQAAVLATPGGRRADTVPLHCGQRRLLAELASGRTVSGAARSLYISPRTAHRWLARAREKLNAGSTVEAIVRLHSTPEGRVAD